MTETVCGTRTGQYYRENVLKLRNQGKGGEVDGDSKDC